MNQTHSEALPHIAGYDITRRLGRGGMADVYLAVQSSLSRPVAIKVLAVERTQGEETVTRFEQEARTIARLDHPNIVSIFDVGLTDDGRLYYVMPYLPNGDLSTRDLRADELGVAAIVRSLVRALGYAHKLGIVHRDVKPENVLFDKLDRPLLADFGIALADGNFLRVTREGSTIGSSGYMSPEQSRGFAIDGRSDLYSLGVVAYEMLSGDLPFKGPDTLAVALAHVEQPIPRLPARVRRWQPFIDKAMAKSPDERFQTAEQMEAALDAIAAQLGGHSDSTYETKLLPTLAPAPRRSWRTHSGLPLVVALIIAGLAMITYAVNELRSHRSEAGAGDSDATTPAAPLRSADSSTVGATGTEPATAPLSVPPPAAEPLSVATSSATPTPDRTNASATPVSEAVPAKSPPNAEPPDAPKAHLTDLAAGAALRDRGGPDLVYVPMANMQPTDAAHGFALARFELTRREYAAFVSATSREAAKCREPHSPLSAFRKLSWREPGFAQEDTHPVVCVSWNDANAYVQWLSNRTHQRYRLPTRAEWLRATHWNSAKVSPCAQGNLADDKRAVLHSGDAGACSDGYEHTAPVGKFKANQIGIHDLIGNVSEWTQDCKDAGRDRNENAAACKDHLFAGSSWRDDSSRGFDYQDDAESDVGYTTIGFRVLREIDDDSIPSAVKSK